MIKTRIWEGKHNVLVESELNILIDFKNKFNVSFKMLIVFNLETKKHKLGGGGSYL